MASWSMSEADAQESVYGSTNSGERSGKVARTSRNAAITGAAMTLRHVPTGIELSGKVVGGHYSRKGMIAEKTQLGESLWTHLEPRVAQHLRTHRL
jgi:hypothetical protein